MRRTLVLPVLALVTLVAGCNDFSTLERGAIGAGAGCLAGETIVNGRCVEGALLGGAAGVLSNRL